MGSIQRKGNDVIVHFTPDEIFMEQILLSGRHSFQEVVTEVAIQKVQQKKVPLSLTDLKLIRTTFEQGKYMVEFLTQLPAELSPEKP